MLAGLLVALAPRFFAMYAKILEWCAQGLQRLTGNGRRDRNWWDQSRRTVFWRRWCRHGRWGLHQEVAGDNCRRNHHTSQHQFGDESRWYRIGRRCHHIWHVVSLCLFCSRIAALLNYPITRTVHFVNQTTRHTADSNTARCCACCTCQAVGAWPNHPTLDSAMEHSRGM